MKVEFRTEEEGKGPYMIYTGQVGNQGFNLTTCNGSIPNVEIVDAQGNATIQDADMIAAIEKAWDGRDYTL